MIDNLTGSIRHYKQKAQTLREYAKPFAEANVGEATKKYIERCLERAEHNEQLAAWLEELAKRREADRWIPVSERLPEDDGQYLVTREEYVPSSSEYRTFDTDGAPHWEMVVDLARFEGNFNRAHNYENHNNGFNKAYKVYAWEPLPKPYESEDK